MPTRVGFLSVAHMHAWGYAPAFAAHRECELVGLWDDDAERAATFAAHYGITAHSAPEALISSVDAVVICSENKKHADWIELATSKGKAVLCEKPICTTTEEAERIRAAGGRVMTAFPCRYSPAFLNLKGKVHNGDLGAIKAVCATNRGRCPWGWFVEPDKSGGGAMIDHVVHVADLLRVLLKSEIVRVQAQIGNNMYDRAWEDTAMLTLEFENGVFASLDSSWSRHKSYKTWGDVTMNVVGEQGLIELDLFSQALDTWKEGPTTHNLGSYGSNLDTGIVNDFLRCVAQDQMPPITAEDGIRASAVAIAGYESAALGRPVSL